MMMPDRNEIPIIPTAEDIERITKLIRARDRKWEAGSRLSLGAELSWTPDLVKGDDAVLGVLLSSRIRPYFRERLEGAFVRGREVHVAVPLSTLFDVVVLERLVTIDAQVHLVEDMSTVRKPASVLAQLADHGISLEDGTRRSVASLAWEQCRQNALASHVKGRRFESLICFLLSQIDGFQVVERNLRTETEEIDAVIQQTQLISARCWSRLRAPFILVEAKNWFSPVTQTEISSLRTKMRGKGDSVRLGLFFAANGYTRDACMQELRFALDDFTIVLIGPGDISHWIAAEDPDQCFERIVRKAMLR